MPRWRNLVTAIDLKSIEHCFLGVRVPSSVQNILTRTEHREVLVSKGNSYDEH